MVLRDFKTKNFRIRYFGMVYFETKYTNMSEKKLSIGSRHKKYFIIKHYEILEFT